LFLLYQKARGDQREEVPNIVHFDRFCNSELCWAEEMDET
jgi:hypothetical protein